MIEIYARLNRQPEHRREDEMADRLRNCRRSLHRREFERMLDTQRHGTAREGGVKKWKRRAVNLSKDFAHYMDFCLARLMVWRALRRERKAGRAR